MAITAEEVVDLLAARVRAAPGPGEVEGPVDLVKGENCRTGRVRPADLDETIAGFIPDECVFVLRSGGPKFRAHKGGDRSDPLAWPGVETAVFHIHIRGPAGDFDRAEQLADAVKSALDMWPSAPEDGWIDARIGEGSPRHLQPETPGGSEEFTLTLEVRKHRR